jgi:phage major head subunit gpT-like protein|nr:MAG TPA: major capsid protein [Caudoviricetes sp.]
MVVNQQALRLIFTGFKTIFAKAFDNSKTLWDKVATLVPSETREEAYTWLGMLPKMREWIGDRQIKNLEASDYTIKNEPFELTIGVPRDDIEDDRLGIYTPVIQSMGQSTATHPDELVFGLLKTGFENHCYDKKPFFCDQHKVGKKIFSNKGTAKLSLESYIAARTAMMSLTDESGNPLKIVPDLLVVPPSLEAKAREILLADQINGTTNTMKGTAEPLVVPDLAGKDDAWYLLCVNRPIKPLIYQLRKAPQFVAKNQETDDNMFFGREAIYGVDSRENAGYGLWQMAYGSDGSGS